MAMTRFTTIPSQPIFWGIMHGINDLFAGYLLARYALSAAPSSMLFWLSVYAVLGFGGQLPVGIFLDRSKRIQGFALAGLALLAIAVFLSVWSIAGAIVFAGLASAFVHVAGGAISLHAADGKAGWLGVFTAPGVLGLAAGTLLGAVGVALPLVIGVLVLLGISIQYLQRDVPYQLYDKPAQQLDSHDWIMLGLLLLMSFRSLVYDILHQLGHYPDYGILYIGLSTFAGKLLGGWMADRLGWKPVIYGSLVAAWLFLGVGPNNLYTLCAGIACIQSSVPLTLLMMVRSLPVYPATGVAFSLGTSVALAGLPLYMFPQKTGWHRMLIDPFWLGMVLVFLLSAWWIWFRLAHRLR
jgi:FSR family fosmidomycin resistance protein-like MFS transporter